MLHLIVNTSFLFKIELWHFMTIGTFFKLFLLTWALPFCSTTTTTWMWNRPTHHVDSLSSVWTLGQKFSFIVRCNCSNQMTFKSLTKALEEQITNSNVSYPFSFIRNDWGLIKMAQEEITVSVVLSFLDHRDLLRIRLKPQMIFERKCIFLILYM